MTTSYTPTDLPGLSTNGNAPSRSGPPTPPATSAGDRLPKLRRPRRPALAVGGALLVLLCGVTSAALATAGDHRVRVLALARDVQAGQVLTPADLKVAQIAGSGVTAIGASASGAVLGETVTASLPAGTLLNLRMLTTSPVPGPGLQLVAIAVKPGGIPEQAEAGRDLSLVRVAAASQPTAGSPTVLVPKARLVSVRTDPASGTVLVSVQVPDAAAATVAQAAASGTIVLTLLPVSP